MKLRTVNEICPDPKALGLTTDLEGWNSEHPLFAQLVQKFKPTTIIECGSWKGRSAIHMGELTQDLGTKIYCCDTWLGEVNLKTKDRDNPDKSPCQYDHAAIYHQFLYNISTAGLGNRVYPIPHESVAAARLLAFMKIKGDLVYIDADHSYDGAFRDLEYYSQLVSDRGILFGDDFRDFPGVRAAVQRFAFENGLRIAVSGPAWLLQPPEETA